MDTPRILALRHFYSLPENQIRLIIFLIDNHKKEVLRDVDIRYFICRGIPVIKKCLKSFEDVNNWLDGIGMVVHDSAKQNLFLHDINNLSNSKTDTLKIE